MAEPYFDEILPGHDCCKNYEYPKSYLTIKPARTLLGSRDSVRLWARGFHLDCDPGCLAWRISQGTGLLTIEFGDETVYESPKYNNDCENNAVIDLICGGKVVSQASVATNTYTPSNLPGYIVIHAKPTLYKYVEGDPLTANPIDKAPAEGRKDVWEEWYRGRSYLCDGTRYETYLLVRTNNRWMWNPVKQKWWIHTTTQNIMNSIVNDHIYFSWKHELGKRLIVDIRSPRMIKEGCCPVQLLPQD